VICERAKTISKSPMTHKCFLNWKNGTTSIEANAIAEGYFLCSDGLIGNTAVLEIKCSFLIKDTNELQTAVDNKKVYLYRTSGAEVI